MQYIPGKDNIVADALSRWVYPANRAFADISAHGSDKDDQEMEAMEEKERQEERELDQAPKVEIPIATEQC